MSGVSVAKKNGGQTSAIFANDTRWRPNSQILHRRDRSNSRVTETARPSGVPPLAARPSGVLWFMVLHQQCHRDACPVWARGYSKHKTEKWRSFKTIPVVRSCDKMSYWVCLMPVLDRDHSRHSLDLNLTALAVFYVSWWTSRLAKKRQQEVSVLNWDKNRHIFSSEHSVDGGLPVGPHGGQDSRYFDGQPGQVEEEDRLLHHKM